MPRKNREGTRDRKKKGGSKSEGFTHYGSQRHIRQVEKNLSQGSNVHVQDTNEHSKDGKGKNK